MLRLIVRWGIRIVLVLVAGSVTVYLGDWVVFQMRGSPQSTVTVSRYLIIPLKGNKQEFDDQGTMAVPCSQTLFPQNGLSPCWQLRRNTNQTVTL